jgi:hypothetical protein
VVENNGIPEEIDYWARFALLAFQNHYGSWFIGHLTISV